MEGVCNWVSAGIGLGERFRAFIRDKLRTTARNVDVFLSERLPDYIEKYDLATRADLSDIEDTFIALEMRVNQLDAWQEDTTTRIDAIKKRMELLEKKYLK